MSCIPRARLGALLPGARARPRLAPAYAHADDAPPSRRPRGPRPAFRVRSTARPRLRPLALAILLATGASAAAAHVAADPSTAAAGAYQAVRFRVGHACSEAATTTALRLEMPAGLVSVKAQPKPGWRLVLDKGPDGAVRSVTWRGVLPPDQFEEFALFLHLPDTPGTLYFPAVQTCRGQETRWTEIPAAGVTARPTHPAPALRLTPAMPAPDAGHHHE